MKNKKIENICYFIMLILIVTGILIFSFHKATSTYEYDYLTEGSRYITDELSADAAITQEIPVSKGDVGVSFSFTTYGRKISGEISVRATGEESDKVYFYRVLKGTEIKNNEFVDFIYNKNVPKEEKIFVAFHSTGEPGSSPALLTTGDDSISDHSLKVNGQNIQADLVAKRITYSDKAYFYRFVFGAALIFSFLAVYYLLIAPAEQRNKFRIFTYYLLIFLAFEFVVYIIHLPMDIISDDANYSKTINFDNLIESIIQIIYYRTTGKILTDSLGFLFYCIPFWFWKIIDTAAYGILMILIWNLFTDKSLQMMFVSSILVLFFPIESYMRSAGYILTSSNYIYTIIGLLAGITPLIKTIFEPNRKIHILTYVMSIFGLIYAVNHEQTGFIAIGVFFMTGAIYFIKWKINGRDEYRRIFKESLIYFIFSMIVYGAFFFTPGHIQRMSPSVEGIIEWQPQYLDWSFPYKIYKGLSTTFANIFFCQPVVFSVFCFALLLYVYIMNKEMIVIPAILYAIVAAVSVIDKKFFIVFHDYAYGMPDLVSTEDSPWGLILSIVIFILIILSVLMTWKPCKPLCVMLIILNVLGFGSRFMMGLSFTIYASSFRTFTPQLFCFIICDVLLSGEIIKKL